MNNIENFIDFKGYGEQRIAADYGQFTDNRYISFHGFISVKEVMVGTETERMGIGAGRNTAMIIY